MDYIELEVVLFLFSVESQPQVYSNNNNALKLLVWIYMEFEGWKPVIKAALKIFQVVHWDRIESVRNVLRVLSLGVFANQELPSKHSTPNPIPR